MDHLNSLPSTNATAPAARPKVGTCDSCPGGTASTPISPSFADALLDEQQIAPEDEALQSTLNETAETPEQAPLIALITTAANDSEHSAIQDLSPDVEESYDSVLQLLSELNAASSTQINLGETAVAANNDQTPLNLSGTEAEPEFTGKSDAAPTQTQIAAGASQNGEVNTSPPTTGTLTAGTQTVATPIAGTPITGTQTADIPTAGAMATSPNLLDGTAQPALANDNNELAPQSLAQVGAVSAETPAPLLATQNITATAKEAEPITIANSPPIGDGQNSGCNSRSPDTGENRSKCH